MSELAISVHGLRKSYGAVEAVRGIDLEVRRGEVFALLGPNGAGKTTTVEILEGYRKRSDGTVSVLGFDPGTAGSEFRAKIGIVLQSTAVDRYLTVEEAIDLFRAYYPMPRPADEVLRIVGLEPQRSTRVKKLSGGQQRRLDVALGLAGDPELLFLDEPTTGFDPSARRNAWEMVRNLADLGKTVLLTTHYMDEAQTLANRVAIMSAGRIVATGDPASLGDRASGKTRITFESPEVPPIAANRENGRFEIETERPVETLHELTSWALASGTELAALAVSQPSLEDVYLELTREPLPE